jgi:hypothetical protein
MIEENVRLCPSACGGVPLHVTHLRANSWINVEINKRRLAAAEARRLAAAEARRLAVEAEREARRLAVEAEREAIRLAAEAEEARRLAEAAEEAKRLAAAKRLANMRKPSKGVVKVTTLSKPEQVQAAQASAAPLAPPSAASADAAPSAPTRSWLARVVSSKLNPRNWSLPWKRTGGTRKYKQHKHRKYFTKRRHN